MREIPETVVKANIRNKVVIVAAVAEERDVKGYENFKHIGLGQYHSIDGKLCTDKKFYHFWELRHD